MKGVCVILFVFLLLNSCQAKPKPEGESENDNDYVNDPVTTTENTNNGGKPDENTVKVDDDDALLTEIPDETLLVTPKETTETEKQNEETEKPSVEPSEDNDDVIIIVTPTTTIASVVTAKPTTEGSQVVVIDGDDTTAENGTGLTEKCGPACQLANQAPFIIFIAILVAIILLLIILFGCYFMKKLYGKTILTAGNTKVGTTTLPKAPSVATAATVTPAYSLLLQDYANLESWKLIQSLPQLPSDTFRSSGTKAVVSSATSADATQKIITTTTTKVTKSVGAFSDVAL